MRKESVHMPEQALAYITDCMLATISSMALLRSRKKYEYTRQKAIAQTAIDWMREMHVDFSTTRAAEVERYGSVEKWAAMYEPSAPALINESAERQSATLPKSFDV